MQAEKISCKIKIDVVSLPYLTDTPGGLLRSVINSIKDKKMTDLKFDAKLREKAGKGAARACRREGRIPAVIYGGKQEPIMISLDPVQVEKALDMVGFYDAEIEIVIGSKKYKVVCQDVQFHPVSDKPIHVDFMRQ